MSLREVIERIQKLDEPPNEEATKFQIVLPILQELGWDFTNPAQVQPEYTIPSTDGDNRKGRVDVALMESPKGNRIPFPVALIEIKAPGANIESTIGQMLRYAFDSSAAIFALTNGLIWWLYLPHETQFNAQERRFAELDLRNDRLQKLIDEFTAYLARSELTTQRGAKRHAKKVLNNRHDLTKARRDLKKEWRKLRDRPDDALFDSVASVIFRSVNQRLSKDQVSALLRNEEISTTQTAQDDARLVRSSAPASSSDETKMFLKRSVAKSEKPSAFVLFGEQHPVENWAGILVGVAGQLYSQHRETDFDLVLKLGTEKNPLIARHRRDNKRADKEIPGTNSSYWIDTGHNRERIVGWCNKMLEALDYSPDDLQIKYETP